MNKFIFLLCISVLPSIVRAENCVLNAREEKVCLGQEVLDLTSIPYEVGFVRALSREGNALVELINRANDEHINGYYRRTVHKLSPSVKCVKDFCVGQT